MEDLNLTSLETIEVFKFFGADVGTYHPVMRRDFDHPGLIHRLAHLLESTGEIRYGDSKWYTQEISPSPIVDYALGVHVKSADQITGPDLQYCDEFHRPGKPAVVTWPGCPAGDL